VHTKVNYTVDDRHVTWEGELPLVQPGMMLYALPQRASVIVERVGIIVGDNNQHVQMVVGK